jgi:dTDP-4-dehydrorhamnose 3,5-epimerase
MEMPFDITSLSIPDLKLIKPRIFHDDRGYFLELYKHSDFSRAEIGEHLVQDNYSKSVKGVLRGLHYQKNPKAQGKLVFCVKGGIYDVVIDLRKGSPYYGKWASVDLTDENKYLLYVPPGFAHGFQVTSDTAEVMYKCTEEYSPVEDRGIIWNDPDLGVPWPLPNALLSEKDRVHPRLNDADHDFVFRVSA